MQARPSHAPTPAGCRPEYLRRFRRGALDRRPTLPSHELQIHRKPPPTEPCSSPSRDGPPPGSEHESLSLASLEWVGPLPHGDNQCPESLGRIDLPPVRQLFRPPP